MTQEFVPYELAVKLKELGFDEPCIAIYSNANPKTGLYTLKKYRLKLIKQSSQKDKGVKAPLYQQAFRWFRDTKLSDSCVCRYQSRDGGIYFYYVVNHDYGVEEIRHYKEGFCSYEEAELACLEKLIEIVESKSE